MQRRVCARTTVTLIVLLLTVALAYGQKNIVVSGRVLDAQTLEPLVGANVFVDNTTNGTATDTNGKFSFTIAAGKTTIVISYLGYQPFNQTIFAKHNTDYTVAARLKPIANALDEISITAKRDKTWETLLNRFQSEFFGSNKNGKACKILNPWVLDLADNKGRLTASSTQPLIITNPALGYKMYFHLNSFAEKDHEYRLKGHVQFIPMVPQSNMELVTWNQNRLEAYHGSLRHFLRSLILGSTEREGFQMYMDKKFYTRNYRSPTFSQELVRAVDPVLPDAIRVTMREDSTFEIDLDRRLEVHYLQKNSTEKLYQDVDHQVSWLNAEAGMIPTNRVGIAADSLDLSVSGSMSDYRVGDLLPFDLDFASSPETNQVEGIILNAQNEKPVSSAQVFVNKSTFGAYSKSDGSFKLGGLVPGFYDVVINAPGFEFTKSRMKIEEGKSYKLRFTLNPMKRSAVSTKSKANDRLGARSLAALQNILMGQFRDSCKLENTNAIAWQEIPGEVRATASAPLKFVNTTLGYVINYTLEKFTLAAKDTLLSGYYWFESMHTEKEALLDSWRARRNERYQYTRQSFLRAVMENRLSDYGFRLVNETKQSAIKIISTPSSLMGYIGVELPDTLSIVHRPMNSISDWYQIKGTNTILARAEKPVYINPLGFIFEENALKWAGKIKEQSISTVPVDFNPIDNQPRWNNIGPLHENVLVRLNKSYYYPREFVWVSGYLFSGESAIRDSLSSTIHVEFLNPQGVVISNNLARVDHGNWATSIYLPDTLNEGMHYLRVYTGWMKNYIKEIGVLPVPIMDYTTNFKDVNLSISNTGSDSSKILSIHIPRSSYPKRTRIVVQAKTDIGLPAGDDIAYASVSVTDANAVKAPGRVWRLYTTPGNERFLGEQYHVIERGVAVTGSLFNKENEKVEGKVELLNMDYQIFDEVQTDTNGNFTFNINAEFYDSADFYFRGYSKSGQRVTVKLNAPTYPDFKKPGLLPDSTVRSENMLARVQNSYQPRENVTVLAEVTVEGKKLDDPRANSSKAERSAIIYGQPDKVFTGDEIRNWGTASNWTEGLNGRVAGVTVTNGRISIRGQGSFSGNAQPLYLVNGVPSTLEVNPNEIERVEIVKRLVSVYGSLGANGIIAIYTKSASTNATATNVSTPANLDYQRIKLKGYTKPLNFRHPDYTNANEGQQPDFRTTLYWNPDLNFTNGTSEFSFSSADIETKYRIQVVGVTKQGRVFVSEVFVDVK